MKRDRRRVTLDLHPRVAAIVERLLRSGLYGVNRTKVVEGLFLKGLRDVVRPDPKEVQRG